MKANKKGYEWNPPESCLLKLRYFNLNLRQKCIKTLVYKKLTQRQRDKRTPLHTTYIKVRSCSFMPEISRFFPWMGVKYELSKLIVLSFAKLWKEEKKMMMSIKMGTENWIIEAPSVGTILAYFETKGRTIWRDFEMA